MSSRRLLLDTHVFLWWLDDNARLGEIARSLIEDADNVVYVSAVSTLEVAIKRKPGKLDAPEQLANIIEEEGFSPLSITPYHGELSVYSLLFIKTRLTGCLSLRHRLMGLSWFQLMLCSLNIK